MPNEENARIFGKTLHTLRLSKNLSTKQLAEIITELLKRENQISIQLISAWENGRKTPSMDTLIALAYFFECSLDYLTGCTRKNSSESEDETPSRKSITRDRISYYDKMPIFIVFLNDTQRKEMGNQYGIIDMDSNAILIKSGPFPLDDKAFTTCRFYAQNPYNGIGKLLSGKLIDHVEELAEFHTVMVKMLSQSTLVVNRYNGVYQNDIEQQCLKNNKNVLPYEGLNKIYTAAVWQSP